MFTNALKTIGRLLFRLVFTALAVPLLLIGRLMGDKPAQHIDVSQPPTEADLAALADWLELHQPHRGELADARLTSIEPPPKLPSHDFGEIEAVFSHWRHTICWPDHAWIERCATLPS